MVKFRTIFQFNSKLWQRRSRELKNKYFKCKIQDCRFTPQDANTKNSNEHFDQHSVLSRRLDTFNRQIHAQLVNIPITSPTSAVSQNKVIKQDFWAEITATLNLSLSCYTCKLEYKILRRVRVHDLSNIFSGRLPQYFHILTLENNSSDKDCNYSSSRLSIS